MTKDWMEEAGEIQARLETHEGRAIYLHAKDCPSFCEYACNGNQKGALLDALYVLVSCVADARAAAGPDARLLRIAGVMRSLLRPIYDYEVGLSPERRKDIASAMAEYDAALTERAAEPRAGVEGDDVAALDDLAARYHSVVHEDQGEDYNAGAIALCQTPRCRNVLLILESLRGALDAAAALREQYDGLWARVQTERDHADALIAHLREATPEATASAAEPRAGVEDGRTP